MAKRHNFLTEEKTIAAGGFTQFGRGGYFRLYSATGPVRIVFKDGLGSTLGEGTFQSGEWAQFDFEQVFIHNDGASAVTVKVRVSPYASGSDSVTLLNGTEAEPLITRDAYAGKMSRNIYQHNVAPGNLSAFYVPPPSAGALKVNGVLMLGNGTFDVGYNGALEATVIAEGVWGAGSMGWALFGAFAPYTAYTLTNSTAAASPVAASAGMMGPVNLGEFMELACPAYIPAGHPSGLVLTFKNTTGITATLGMQLVCEEMA